MDSSVFNRIIISIMQGRA